MLQSILSAVHIGRLGVIFRQQKGFVVTTPELVDTAGVIKKLDGSGDTHKQIICAKIVISSNSIIEEFEANYRRMSDKCESE